MSHIARTASYLLHPDLVSAIYAMVISRLEYCSLLFVGLLLRLIQQLQLIQNVALRFFTGIFHRGYIKPALCKLNCIPVEYQIRFKILVLTFKGLMVRD